MDETHISDSRLRLFPVSRASKRVFCFPLRRRRRRRRRHPYLPGPTAADAEVEATARMRPATHPAPLVTARASHVWTCVNFFHLKHPSATHKQYPSRLNPNKNMPGAQNGIGFGCGMRGCVLPF